MAAALPLVVPFAAILVLAIGSHVGRQAPRAITGWALLFVIIGLYSTLPYLLFLLVARKWLVRADAATLRKIAWLAPILIAIPFAPVFALTAGSGGGVREFMNAMGIGAAWALVVGYLFVVVIEAVRALAIWSGSLNRRQG